AGNFWKTVKPGDSGGPLLVLFEKKYYLVGVISASTDSFMGFHDQEQYPALFTRIKTECEFFKEHTNFECYNNIIPLRESDERKHVCGHTVALSDGNNLHPWYCRMYDGEGRDFCGATLISFKYALTAAHCIQPKNRNIVFNTDTFYIKCGLKQQKRLFKKVIVAPGYHKSSVKDDIAILEFNEDFEYDGDIVPICLPPESYPS
ncbi:hypothetical protein FO519_010758, partial [Halicephalobus sp. NKZ332]